MDKIAKCRKCGSKEFCLTDEYFLCLNTKCRFYEDYANGICEECINPKPSPSLNTDSEELNG